VSARVKPTPAVPWTAAPVDTVIEPSSTLNRLWKDPDWVVRSTGSALQQLVAVMPDLSAYLVGRGFTTAAQRHLRTLSAVGVALRLPAPVSVDQVAALGNALGVATAIVNCNRDEVCRRLSLGWRLPITRYDNPAASPREISSRSARLKHPARRRWGG
jgi:hypothetical protein